MDFCCFPPVCYRINHLGNNGCRHQKCATSSETGFTKGALQGNLCLLSLAASIQLNNDIKDPLHDVRPGRAADLASPSLDETTTDSN